MYALKIITTTLICLFLLMVGIVYRSTDGTGKLTAGVITLLFMLSIVCMWS